MVHGVGLDGCFVPEVEPVAGKFFKDADPILVADLESRGLMYRSERYLHNYPHGWRTGDPLIYYAKHAWYIGDEPHPRPHGGAQPHHQLGP